MGRGGADIDSDVCATPAEFHMRAEDYSTRTLELQGWKVKLTSYRLGNTFHCTADNVEPGAWIARAQGATREEAEERACQRARELLARTPRVPTI